MAQILVVDDNPICRRMLTRSVAALGHRPLACASGAEALRHCLDSAAPPALVLLDVFMPEPDGIETLAALRQSHPHLPIVMHTGGHSLLAEPVLAALPMLGATAILRKPFGHHQLAQAVAAILGPAPAPPAEYREPARR